MKVSWTLNKQKTTQNDLHFGLIFLTCWLVDSNGKLESLPNLLRVYRVYSEPKKRIYSRINSQE